MSHHTSCDNICVNRNFLKDSSTLRCKLGRLQQNGSPPKHRKNKEEKKYKHKAYNGSFHKCLQHDNITGQLVDSSNYKKYKHALLKNNQQELAKIQMAVNFQVKWVDPLGAFSTILIGIPQNMLILSEPPFLASKSAAAEMIELYALMLARDVSFINYTTDPIIQSALQTLSQPHIQEHLKDHLPITINTLFKGITLSEQAGPYISQLLLLDITIGGLTQKQRYKTLPTKASAIRDGYTNEWGRNRTEMINIENTMLNALPPYPTTHLQKRYAYSGRALTEIVHHDVGYQFYYQAANVLLGLGAKINVGFPVYPNQSAFVSESAAPSLLCAIAEVADLAIKHVWYWKWLIYRRLRPEAFSLWIDNVKTGIVSNNNYDISELILNNPILNSVVASNQLWGFLNSFTLPMPYLEGSPAHPSFPAAHAGIAGACCTIMKIFLDTEQPWLSLPGIATIPAGPVVQSNDNGSTLINYNTDVANMTINGEINKLASNIGIARMWAGIHYRSDIFEGMKLGEKVAIRYAEDMLSTMVQNNLNGTVPSITFRKFDGYPHTIKPTLCY